MFRGAKSIDFSKFHQYNRKVKEKECNRCEAVIVRRSRSVKLNNAEMVEWSIAAVLKTVDGKLSGGSNPSLCAK